MSFYTGSRCVLDELHSSTELEMIVELRCFSNRSWVLNKVSMTFTNKYWNRISHQVWDVFSWISSNKAAILEIIEISWEIYWSSNCTLLCYWSKHKFITKHKLCLAYIISKSLLIFVIMEEYWLENCTKTSSNYKVSIVSF